MHTVGVVFDTEYEKGPRIIGAYIRTEEDVVVYADHDDAIKYAPIDCVYVARVSVPW